MTDAPPQPTARRVSVVIPLLDEEAVLPELLARLRALAEAHAEFAWEFLLVDDGSRDATPRLLEEAARDPGFKSIALSRNFGHQPAISAGLDFAEGDVVAVIDGDLQDPPEILPEMLRVWQRGADVVYAVRRTRQESLPLRLAYKAFYRLLRWASQSEIQLDAGDCCVMDRRVVDVLQQLPDRSRFVRGLRAWVGFRQEPFPYDRASRRAGEAKYTWSKLLLLAADGLVSFSEVPLRLASWLGVALVSGSLIYAIVIALLSILPSWQNRPVGFATLIVAVAFLSGLQILVMSVLGEYVIRIFRETKQRPLYVVKETRNLAGPARPPLGIAPREPASALAREQEQ
jgi:dolichol-phosphate mannosyltransferase